MIARPRSMRRLINRCGFLLGFLFLIAAADTFVGGHLDRKDAFRALPGTRLPISGNLYRPVRHPEDVQFHFNDPGLALSIAEVRGSFWRGEVTVPTTAAEGVYRLSAITGADTDPEHVPVYRITVFSSKAALNASYPSLIRRFFGFPSWWIAAVTGPLLAICLALAFYLTADREGQLDEAGVSPILKLARRKTHWELAAALPAGHAISPGDTAVVVDRHRQPVAGMTVTHIEKGMVFGQVDAVLPVGPDGFVRFSPTQKAEARHVPVEADT